MSTANEMGGHAFPHDVEPERKTSAGSGLIAVGGLLGAMASSSCCVIPLALFSVGIGGAWIGNLTALAPYQPIFVVLTMAILGYGFHVVYWRPRRQCATGPVCVTPASARLVKGALWFSTVLVLIAGAFPFAAPYLLEVY